MAGGPAAGKTQATQVRELAKINTPCHAEMRGENPARLEPCL